MRIATVLPWEWKTACGKTTRRCTSMQSGGYLPSLATVSSRIPVQSMKKMCMHENSNVSNTSAAGRRQLFPVRSCAPRRLLEASLCQNTHECLCNADSVPRLICTDSQYAQKALAMTKFPLFLIQQKEPLQPSKPKPPTRNLLLTPASARKTPTPPPRSPTLAASMLRHLRERRAAPRPSST